MKRIWLVWLCCVAVPVAAFSEAEKREAPRHRITVRGTLVTGVMAVGGETTGVVLMSGKTMIWELELNAEQRRKADLLNGKVVAVEGVPYVRAGVEVGERRILKVSRIELAVTGSTEKEKRAAPG